MNSGQQLYSNTVIWLILITALVCYFLLFELLFDSNKGRVWRTKVASWLHTLKVLLNCLPLLGLFGTIVGLLSTFTQMSYASMDQQELLSSGIADALLTTQVGILMVIPGWLMLAYLKRIFLHYEALSLLNYQQNQELKCVQN
jgi:biopolymer transport protein ExbB